MSFKQSRWHFPLKLTKRTASFCHQSLDTYQSTTLTRYNQDRRQFLPTFPNTPEQSKDQSCLLLANVPGTQLSTMDSTRRTSGIYPHPLNMSVQSNQVSYIHEKVAQWFGKISQFYQIDVSILNYNLSRLVNIIHVFMSNYRLCERSLLLFDHGFVLSQNDLYARMLSEKELFILLEFFLQIDVDVFYMKVCTFQIDETIHHKHSQLFSNEDILYMKKDFSPCGRSYCTLCSCMDQTSDLYANTSDTILFSNAGHQYRFLNNYLAILNRSATCQTQNIIYVLQCICGEYEYIGSTQYTLYDVLQYHRAHVNRLIIEHLLFGHALSNMCTCSQSQIDKLRANQMRLYQHFVRCRVALKLFLQNNPLYWCFVPMKVEEAYFDDLSYQTSITSLETNAQTNPDNKQQMEKDKTAQHFQSNILEPPKGYTFSKRQKHEQTEFCRNTQSEPHFPCSNSDYYHLTIIAVLPDHSSNMFRQVIEVLLATHAETKLNSMNLLTSDMSKRFGLPYDNTRVWCENLRPS